MPRERTPCFLLTVWLWAAWALGVPSRGDKAGLCRERGPSCRRPGWGGCKTACEQYCHWNREGPSAPRSLGNPRSEGLSATVQLSLLTALNYNPLGLKVRVETAGRDRAQRSVYTWIRAVYLLGFERRYKHAWGLMPNKGTFKVQNVGSI